MDGRKNKRRRTFNLPKFSSKKKKKIEKEGAKYWTFFTEEINLVDIIENKAPINPSTQKTEKNEEVGGSGFDSPLNSARKPLSG